ncbi:ATP-binding protein [Kocuria sp. M1N1S27]|uniref:ATP-binding protein n=1 Tax=Kocuria kalidii TaxID=3376283 RepID=UPI0037BE1774
MPEDVACRSRRGPATSETVEAIHDDIDSLWTEAASVPETDRMAFTLAVVEAATNVVVHAVPLAETSLELRVELTAGPCQLQAKIYEIGAAPAGVSLRADHRAQELEESGRGIALIQALVSTVVFQRCDDANVWELRREYHRG